MIKYDIYGIGGALVDTEVKVSDEFLSLHELEKGVMTLVDEFQQTRLMDSLAGNEIYVLRQSGGSVCNSLVAASYLGSKTFFSGKVADDSDGHLYIEDLQNAGVAFQGARQEIGVTGKCIVLVTPDAERTMNTFLGVSEYLGQKEIDKVALSNSNWFYIEGYLLTDTSRAKMLRGVTSFAKEHNVKIALTLSDPFIAEKYRGSIKNLIGGGVDLIFCNRDEALKFTDTTELESASDKLKKYSKTFVITDGVKGAITFDGNEFCHVNATPMIAIDSNGAGDMFAGAFLNRITAGKSYREAAKFANSCAARVVTKFGPRLKLSDFKELATEFGIE